MFLYTHNLLNKMNIGLGGKRLVMILTINVYHKMSLLLHRKCCENR